MIIFPKRTDNNPMNHLLMLRIIQMTMKLLNHECDLRMFARIKNSTEYIAHKKGGECWGHLLGDTNFWISFFISFSFLRK